MTSRRQGHTPANTFTWVAKLAWQHGKLPVFISMLEQLLLALIPLGQALALGGLVSVLSSPAPSWQGAWPWALLLFMSYLAGQSFLFMSFKEFWYEHAFQKALDEPVLQKVTRIGLISFEDSGVHDLISRVGEPSGRAQQLIEDMLRWAGSWLKVIILGVYVGTIVWWLAPVMIAVVPLLSRMMGKIGERYRQFEQSISVPAREASYAATLMTSRESAREMRLFDLSRYVTEKWRSWVELIHRERMKHDLGMMGRIIVARLPHIAVLFGAIMVLAYAFRAEQAGLDQFVAGVMALLSLVDGVRDITWNVRGLAEGREYMQEVRGLLDLPEESSGEGTMSFPRLMRKGLTFENVTFSYPGADRPALSRVSLSIKPGERLALVGPNGAGKSTLIKLLLGLYRPDEGRITVDGIDMGDLNMEDRRRAMAAVFQDYATFSLTVRENIALSALEQIDNTEAIIRAAQEGGAHSFVEQLNLGYDTPLGKLVKGSHEPSEGQWQRLAISRGLMRDAEILILDEPTASLDPMAEVGLYRHFTQLLKGRTVILVTHRLGSARMTDRIAVLHEGQVVETGSHDELIKASGTYAEMFESQAEWYREGEVS